MDIVYLVLTLLLFGAAHLYVEGCARLKGKGSRG
jgi:hypothetical protein